MSLNTQTAFPKVAIAILNWNGKHFLEQFLPSVIQFSKEADIYVIDNDSADGSVEFLKTHIPSVHIIQNSTNEGFCKGYNSGLSQIAADYYILLNSDVEVTEGWLNPVIHLMDKQPEIAVCQPKIKSFTHKAYFEYAGAAGGFLDKFGYPFCRGRIFDTIEEDRGQYDQCIEITWASGACFFVRASVYQQLGGLDEDFFAHMEEIDFCWRAINEGHKVYICPDSTVYHVGGGTLNKTNPFKTFLNFRNGLYLLHKNLPAKSLFPVIFQKLILDGVAAFQFLVSGKIKDVFAIIKAHNTYFRSIPNLNKKRPSHHLKDNVLCNYSIVWRHFIRRKNTFSSLTGF